MKRTAILREPVQAEQQIDEAWRGVKGWLVGNGAPLRLRIDPCPRTVAANARMWAMLAEVADQVVWHGRKMTPTEWKHMFTASWSRYDAVPGIDAGTTVVLGRATSEMSGPEISALMALIEAFGTEHRVVFRASDDWKE